MVGGLALAQGLAGQALPLDNLSACLGEIGADWSRIKWGLSLHCLDLSYSNMNIDNLTVVHHSGDFPRQ